jgi:C4-type Zn-finger protein
MEHCVKECVQCGADMIAATWAGHLSDHCVLNVWSCEACGYQSEDLVYLSVQARGSLGGGHEIFGIHLGN